MNLWWSAKYSGFEELRARGFETVRDQASPSPIRWSGPLRSLPVSHHTGRNQEQVRSLLRLLDLGRDLEHNATALVGASATGCGGTEQVACTIQNDTVRTATV
jgi:hypothetical protein